MLTSTVGPTGSGAFLHQKTSGLNLVSTGTRHAHAHHHDIYRMFAKIVKQILKYYFILGPGPCELYLSACIRVVQ